MQIVSGTALAILSAIIDTGGPFDPAGTFVGLFTGITNRGANTVMSDLTLAPSTMGTALAVTTWGTPYVLDSGAPVVDGAVKVFAPASGAGDADIVGWFLTDAATAGNLLAFSLIGGGVAISFSPLKKLTIVPRLSVPLDGTWDVSVIWDG